MATSSRFNPASSGDRVTTEDVPLYQRDPEAWNAYLAEGNRTQPRKRVAADVIFRDEAGRILLVDPNYKPDWDLPGGMAEANEPPLEAARREVREELGIELGEAKLLVVDWVTPHDPWDDLLMFVFDGGTLGEREYAALSLPGGELREMRFCAPEQARTLLSPRAWPRVEQALVSVRTGVPVYLHDGRRI